VAKEPFTQLWTVHAFIKSGQSIAQIPLVFVLMSGKRTLDYVAVFNWIRDNVQNLELKSMTCDFEAAVWAAAEEVFPGVELHGCLFHWNQSIYRKIQV
jgi:hypothetical protein